MKVVIQRVSEANVRIEGDIKGAIDTGLVVLLGIEDSDDEKEIEWLVNKVVNCRIFSDQDGKMNLSVKDIEGEILIISQFTLHASTKKGNRPSYILAAHPDKAIPLYESFITETETALGKTVETGVFGADMKVSLLNDGPVTIIIDSKNRV